MSAFPDTPKSLIVRIQHEGQNIDWTKFIEIYEPVIVGFLRSRGLQDADVRDVTQEVLRAVFHGLKRFEMNDAKGRFRDWLFGIVRHKLVDHWRHGRRLPIGPGDPEIQRAIEALEDGSFQAEWNLEYQRRLFLWAANQIRGEFSEPTWRAFQLTCIDGIAEEVAPMLNMTVGDVYVRKCRVLARLRKFLDDTDFE